MNVDLMNLRTSTPRANGLLILMIALLSLNSFGQGVKGDIVWKNIAERYSNFKDVKPTISNETGRTIYFDNYYYPSSIVLERLVDHDRWEESSPWRCGTGYKPALQKLKSFTVVVPNLYDEFWYTSTVDDYVTPRFTRYPDYSGRGKYRMRFTYGFDKRSFNNIRSYSPVFEVIERLD